MAVGQHQSSDSEWEHLVSVGESVIFAEGEMTGQILSLALAVSMVAAQKSATDCFTYFPMGGDSFGYSSDEGGSGTSYLGVDTRNLTSDRLSELN